MLKTLLLGFALILFAAAITVIVMQPSTKWVSGEANRTPDSQFENLADYDFQANYAEVQGYRIHYVDEGPRDGQVVLLMHGLSLIHI